MGKVETPLVYSILIMVFVSISCSKNDEMSAFTDERDGKTYQLFEYGSLVWMKENLNFVSDGSWSYDNSSSNSDEFGRLYSWYSAVNACPDGWRLPTHEEYSTMIDNLGGLSEAGSALKSGEHLALLMGGYRTTEETFTRMGDEGAYWTGSEVEMVDPDATTEAAWNIAVFSMSDETRQRRVHKEYGFSVRCIQQ